MAQSAPSSVTVTEAAPVVRVHKQKNININIDEYDEDALEDYYRALKSTVKVLSTFSGSTPEEVRMLNGKMGGSFSMLWSSITSGQLEIAKIELESWPLEARKEGWAILGKRITKYNKLFNRHRKALLANEAIAESTKATLTDFEFVTEETLLAD